jgi:hypothetical protein
MSDLIERTIIYDKVPLMYLFLRDNEGSENHKLEELGWIWPNINGGIEFDV